MKLILKGESREIADLILAMQEQQKTINVTQTIPKNLKNTAKERGELRKTLQNLAGHQSY